MAVVAVVAARTMPVEGCERAWAHAALELWCLQGS